MKKKMLFEKSDKRANPIKRAFLLSVFLSTKANCMVIPNDILAQGSTIFHRNLSLIGQTVCQRGEADSIIQSAVVNQTAWIRACGERLNNMANEQISENIKQKRLEIEKNIQLSTLAAQCNSLAEQLASISDHKADITKLSKNREHISQIEGSLDFCQRTDFFTKQQADELISVLKCQITDMKDNLLESINELHEDVEAAIYRETKRTEKSTMNLANVMIDNIRRLYDEKLQSEITRMGEHLQMLKKLYETQINDLKEAISKEIKKKKHIEEERDLHCKIGQVISANAINPRYDIIDLNSDRVLSTDIIMRKSVLFSLFQKICFFSELLSRSDLEAISEYINAIEITDAPIHPGAREELNAPWGTGIRGFRGWTVVNWQFLKKWTGHEIHHIPVIEGTYNEVHVFYQTYWVPALNNYDKALDEYNRLNNIREEQIRTASTQVFPSRAWDKLIQQYNSFLKKFI